MSDKTELKACPFCGEPGEEREERGWYACSNNDCPAWHIQSELEDWNRRAALAQQPAPVAVPSDQALRSRVADLLHLLQFAKIETPSDGDAAQAEVAMNDLERMLAAPAAPVAVGRGPVAVVDANDDSMWADILPDVSVKVGDLLYSTPLAAQSDAKPILNLIEDECLYWHSRGDESRRALLANLLSKANEIATQQPDTVTVSRELLERACTKRSAPGGYRVAMDAIMELRALMAGGNPNAQ